MKFRDTIPAWSCGGQGSSARSVDVPVHVWDPLELARRIPNPCFYRGGKRIAAHTQPVFKNKTKPHSCCLSEQGRRLFSVLVEAIEKCRAGRV